MHIDWLRQEINVKIVYYGPGMSGKTTNLKHIHARVSPERRMTSLQTGENRTLFFDFLSLEVGTVAGKKPRLNLYAAPGQAICAPMRQLLLREVDGVVFVADSQPSRLEANIISMESLERYLAEMEQPLDSLPLVLQFNKRDLPEAMPLELLRQQLGRDGVPCFEAVASQGVGVFESLKAIVGLIMKDPV